MNKNPDILLRKTDVSDLDVLFKFQLDEEACSLAAFMPEDHTNKIAYISKYTRFLNDPSINNQTILVDNTIVGSIAKFTMEGKVEITYWIDRKYWGQGIATKALSEFLNQIKERPVYARVAFDNFGSQRVLINCGFTKIGSDKGYANARERIIEEFIYKID
ncbi:GNAT family N-acetyltransferase [Sphingobacterium kyonggiense]